MARDVRPSSPAGGAGSAVTLITANRALSRLIDAVPLARIFEGRPTTVIEGGKVVQPALRKLGMRTSELDHATRSQHGDDLQEIEHGELTPSGQFVLTLKPHEQSSTKADIVALEQRLQRIEAMRPRGGDRTGRREISSRIGVPSAAIATNA